MNIAATIQMTIHHATPALWHAWPLVAALRSHQEIVDDYFHIRSAHWRDVYFSEGLSSTIYRTRQGIVLRLFDSLCLAPGSRVMDIGCGAGIMAVTLAQRGFTVDAVDTVPAMIEQTRRLSQINGVGSRLHAGFADVRNLGFSDGTFDAVLAIGVLPWVDHPLHGLRELARVLKPGGHAIIATDNHWALNNILDPFCFPGFRVVRRRIRKWLENTGIFRRPAEQPQLSFHSIRNFDSMLSTAGFTKLDGRTYGFGPFTFLKIPLCPDSLGIRLHRRLQILADQGCPALRSSGVGYVVLARSVEPRSPEGASSRRPGQWRNHN